MYLRFFVKIYANVWGFDYKGVTDVERDRVGKLIALLCMHLELKILFCTGVQHSLCNFGRKGVGSCMNT